MSTRTRLFVVTILVISTNFFLGPIFSMRPVASSTKTQKPAKPAKESVTKSQKHIDHTREIANAAVRAAKDAVIDVNEANTRALDAIRMSTAVDTQIKELSPIVDALRQRIELMQPTAALVDEAKNTISEHAKVEADAIAALLESTKIPAEERIRVAREAAQAGVSEGAKNLREILNDSMLMMKIGSSIIAVALCIYTLKYGIPAYINYLTQPYLISETSRASWLNWFKSQQPIEINELIFTPYLQNQLQNLLLRVQTAKKYDIALPNVLFHGPSGTGKTTIAKALAYASGLDYALTSGSEFAKITDLAKATNELRNILDWAKKSENGLILFIDEAESLFANRKLPTTPKQTQDFINTFLSLVSDQSQKKVMFILATNHPFKLDDAIVNRIGINAEFTLPTKTERSKILYMYLMKYAQENKAMIVAIQPEVEQSLPIYSERLEGFSPRAIKFLAEEMIVSARQQKHMQLTSLIAQEVIDQELRKQQEVIRWEKERDNWSRLLKKADARIN